MSSTLYPSQEIHGEEAEQVGIPGPRVGKARLLLADDNPVVLWHVCDFLAKDFDIVAAVADPEVVLDKVEDLNPDVIILDISMGRMSGLEILRLLREQGYMAPVVFLTVHQESDFVKAALDCGASAYVVKAHLTNDLIPAIHAVLLGDSFLSPCLGHLV